MMKKVLIIIFFFVVGFNALDAQQRYFDERYIYTHHFVNPALINPAYSGIDENKYIYFNYRNKWASFPGSPKTVTFGYSGNLVNRLSIGGMLLNDSNGGLRTTKGQLSLAYTIDAPTNKVGFGISTEFIQHKVSGDVLNNGLLDLGDQVILGRLDGHNFFDVTFGVYGVYENKFTYGVSLPSLVSSKLDDENGAEPDRELGYIFNVGYIHRFQEHDIVMEPSLIFKKLMFVPNVVDVNLKLKFLEGKFTGGITYGVGADERFGFLLGTKVNNLNFYYSYNVSRHNFQNYNNGSHEISVAVNIGKNSVKETMTQEMLINEEM